MDSQNNFFHSLAALHYVCQHQHIPFVSYRLPLHAAITTLVQYQSQPATIKKPEELNKAEGFVFSPFTENNEQKTIVLKPDLKFKDNNISTEFISELSTCNLFTDNSVLKNKPISTSKIDFENCVKHAVEAINKGEFRKVVVSKIQNIDLPNNFSAPHLFQKLCATYPHAYVYFLQLPGAGCWIGATPEPLLTTDGDQMQTVSLAGTQQATNIAINEYSWTDKEIEEQEIVTNFVEKVLQESGIQNYSKSKTENYKAANLIHLKSSFAFEYSTTKNQLSKLIQALHPTPSVGGLPRYEAIQFINAHEKHNRAYYTGFLGDISASEGVNLFVNLRCMQLTNTYLTLYSGAGITASSVPEKEWDETENKLMTLKQVLFSS